jgi:hypothetical protein
VRIQTIAFSVCLITRWDTRRVSILIPFAKVMMTMMMLVMAR